MKTKTTRVINLSVADVTAAINAYLVREGVGPQACITARDALSQEIELKLNFNLKLPPGVEVEVTLDGATVTIIESEEWTVEEDDEDS